MHISHHSKDVSALSHAGERYEPDADGRFEVPNDLGERMLETPGWSIAPAPEPEADEAPAKPRTRTRKAKDE